MKELADCLEAQAGRSLEHALQLCQRSMRRLRERTNGLTPSAGAPQDAAARADAKLVEAAPVGRKPVASVTGELQNVETEKQARAS